MAKSYPGRKYMIKTELADKHKHFFLEEIILFTQTGS